MSDQNSSNSQIPFEKPVIVEQLVYILALLLVLLGLVNVTPAIPGWDNLWKDLTGNEFFRIRRFPTEWLFPITFFWMMLIVALKKSMWRSWTDKNTTIRRFGLFMDAALIIAAAAISITYLIEIEAVCLIDRKSVVNAWSLKHYKQKLNSLNFMDCLHLTQPMIRGVQPQQVTG